MSIDYKVQNIFAPNCIEIRIKIYQFSYQKTYFKQSCAKWQSCPCPQCVWPKCFIPDIAIISDIVSCYFHQIVFTHSLKQECSYTASWLEVMKDGNQAALNTFILQLWWGSQKEDLTSSLWRCKAHYYFIQCIFHHHRYIHAELLWFSLQMGLLPDT